MSDEPQNIHNDGPNQGAQGQFYGPVNIDRSINVHGDVIGTGIAIGDNNVVQVTTVYEWTRRQPADPQTIAAAQTLFGYSPTETIPEIATLPPGSRAPSRVQHFVGRTPDLRAIAAALTGGQAAVISQAATVHGLGGVGKTSVATEFSHRYGAYFAGGVYWLSFADPANIPFEVAQCGGEGGMQLRPDFAALELKDQVAAVQRAWAEDIPRLLVFDNVDSDDGEKLVQQWRPPTGGCRVLITSRRGVWDKSLRVTALPLGVLPRAESIALLREFRADLSDADADAVAAELGDLPLALHLAASSLALYDDLNVAEYLDELRSDSILQHESLHGVDLTISPTNHDLHVGRTFAASYRRLDTTDATDALALALLARAACFAPGEVILRDLLLQTVDLPEKADQRRGQRALRRLRALGLLAQEETDLLLHRLLAQFVQESASDTAAQAAVERAIIRVASDLNDKAIPAPMLAILPHLRHISDVALERADEQSATLAANLGYCLSTMFADYAAARSYFERALEITEAVLGPQHPQTATSLNNLGGLLDSMGELAAARPYYERALEITEAVLGPQHPQTATSLNNLGGLLHAQGELTAARPYVERALAIREAVLGPQHPDTAGSLNNLGGLLDSMGELAAARPYYERALEITKAVLGPQHPQTATSLNNLGLLLHAQGDLVAARPYYECALEITEAVLGPQHPATATSLNNLGLLLHVQGELAAARPCFERALAIFEAVLGPQHPDTAQSLNSLGIQLLEIESLPIALQYNTRAITAQPKHDLYYYWQAIILLAQGDLIAADAALEQSYQLASEDTLPIWMTQFWRGVLADLEKQAELAKTFHDQTEKSLPELDSSAGSRMQGLLAAYKGDKALARSAYSDVLTNRQELSKLTSHRVYLKVLARLFPENAILREVSIWLSTELKQRMLEK